MRLGCLFNKALKYLLVTASVVSAQNTAAKMDYDSDNLYKPVLNLSTQKIENRKISQMNLMLPLWQAGSHLTMLDIKLNHDNRNSFESNYGLVYRHNFDDKWIFGIYNYWDHKKTSSNLYTHQSTIGTEILSHYLDARVNFYIPSNNKHTIAPYKAELKRNGSAIYALIGGEIKEQALPGYDVEIGFPVFGLTPPIDNSLGTRFYVAKYNFHKKFVQNNTGIRVRLEQNLFEKILAKQNIALKLHIGKNFAYRHKDSSFIGLSIRVNLSNKKSKRTRFQNRMMDSVVRDIDIVTAHQAEELKVHSVFFKDQEIKDIYFLGGSDEDGEGSPDSPFSKRQWEQMLKEKKFVKKDTDLVIFLGDESLATLDKYNKFVDQHSLVSLLKDDVELKNEDASVTFKMKDYFLDVTQQVPMKTERVPVQIEPVTERAEIRESSSFISESFQESSIGIAAFSVEKWNGNEEQFMNEAAPRGEERFINKEQPRDEEVFMNEPQHKKHVVNLTLFQQAIMNNINSGGRMARITNQPKRYVAKEILNPTPFRQAIMNNINSGGRMARIKNQLKNQPKRCVTKKIENPTEFQLQVMRLLQGSRFSH